MKNQYRLCPICNEVYNGRSCPNWRQSPHPRKFAERAKKWGDLGPLTKVTIRLPSAMLARFQNRGGVQKAINELLIGPVALRMADEKTGDIPHQDN